uniref:Tryptophan synthase beta chain-like PALP domain-containing protein n=1 Tax=Chloropicon laureae TaxID=464258 RepID=A0A7S3E457_9CHLO
MLMPAELPELDVRGLAEAEPSHTYKSLCRHILGLFTDKSVISESDLGDIIEDAFRPFDIEEVVRLQAIRDENENGAACYVAELWHGPTLAFKDLSMQVLCGFMETLLAKQQRRLNLVVATSGDTGASAIAGVLGKRHLSVTVLYPSPKFSSISVEQEEQTLRHAGEPNVTVVNCEGTSDDLDVPIEACFGDLAFKEAASIGSVNSVNVFRVIMQVVHYVYCWLQLRRAHPERRGLLEVSFYVPSGGCGHISAGILARAMGLPIRTLFACVNANDVLHSLLQTGHLDSNPNAVPTLAPSMDIVVPYNLERILFLMSGRDQAKVRAWMTRWKKEGKVQLGGEERAILAETMGLRSVSTSDEQILSTIAQVHRECGGYVIDPHTAVAAAACLSSSSSPDDGVPRVIMGCAHPGKFTGAVSKALGNRPASDWMPLGDRAHPAVAAILALQERAKGGDDLLSRETPGVHHFVKGQDWERTLRGILTSSDM